MTIGLALTALAAANAMGYAYSEVVYRLDCLIYDLRLKASAGQVQVDPRILIVDIDERSLAEEGRWPWSRDRVGDLIVKLTDELGAAVVGFDVVFAEPQESDAEQALRLLVEQKPSVKSAVAEAAPSLLKSFDHDGQLAEVLKQRPVVLGYYFNQNPQNLSGALPKPVFKVSQLSGQNLQSTEWQGFGANLPTLQRAATAGFFNPILDPDGLVRAVPMLVKFNEGYYESLALAILRKALGNPQLIPVFPEGVEPDYGALEYIALRSAELELNVPVERGLISMVNFRGRGGPNGGGYRYVSASDVLGGRISARDVEGRIVLVGTTAPGLLDLRSTPVNPAFPGVEVHANVLSAILDQEFKIKPEYAPGVLLITVLAVGATLSVLMPMLSAAWSLAVAGVVLLASLAVNSWLYFQAGLVLPLASVLLLVLGIFLLDVAVAYLSESRSKRAMVNLFGEYVAPELVREMAEDPASYSMEGESKVLTVLFSDVRGFTSISESLEPNELREYINEYLTTMSEIIRSHRGTLDKYIGDAIMAFWGAPIHDADHAQLATQAAMAMQAEAIRLNQRFKLRNWPALAIGVGVNTGQMRVGDMGSKIRRAYTVMGDAVNLGSRLEGITKTYGVGVICGEVTVKAIPSMVFKELDKVRVKGKDEPVAIYQPLGLNTELQPKDRQLLERWNQALLAFRNKQWDLAEQHFHELKQGDSNGVLYTLYLDRIAVFRLNPPPELWDGVTTFETK